MGELYNYRKNLKELFEEALGLFYASFLSGVAFLLISGCALY